MAPEQGILAETIDLHEETLPRDPDPTLGCEGGGPRILGPDTYMDCHAYWSPSDRSETICKEALHLSVGFYAAWKQN